MPTVDDRIRASAAKVLPFKLTPGQRQAVKEIVDDMRRPQPMHRLLQGDVGAGKTIVALLAAIVAMENGLQVAFMAPTEILAEAALRATSRGCWSQSRFRVDLLTGSTPGLQKHTLHVAHRARHHEPGRRHARAGAGERSRSTSWGSSSSTSSIASAWRSAPRCARRACGPTCC